LAVAAFGFRWAAGLAVAAFGFGAVAGLAVAAFGFRWAAGLAVAVFGFDGAAFAASIDLDDADFEAARDFDATDRDAFAEAFTGSSVDCSLGSACSALGRRGEGTGFELLLDQTRRTESPARTVPPRTTRAFMPRIRSSRPTGELIQRSASLPKRALNLAHPVWGCSLTSSSAEPIARRLPCGSASMLRSKST
jgi:hypothetical protein